MSLPYRRNQAEIFSNLDVEQGIHFSIGDYLDDGEDASIFSCNGVSPLRRGASIV